MTLLTPDSNLMLTEAFGQMPPKANVQLDRESFKQRVQMLVVGLTCDRLLKTNLEKLRPVFPPYINLPKPTKTYLDRNGMLRKLILIQPPKSCAEFDYNWIQVLRNENIEFSTQPMTIDLSNSCTNNSNLGCTTSDSKWLELVSAPCSVEITIGYDNLTMDQVLKKLLPEFALPLSGFTVMGHVVQFNLRPETLPFRHIIGQVALDKIPNTRTAVHKASIIESTYRTFEIELLAGVPDYVTSMRENGVLFHFDMSKVYWNPRLGTEHTRITSSLRTAIPSNDPYIPAKLFPGDRVVVYDVFAGVGPFAIPAARLGCHVFANDINPESYAWLLKNVSANSSRKHKLENISCYNLDGREFIRKVLLPHYRQFTNRTFDSNGNPIEPKFHRFVVLMNLPALAPDFLDAFVEPIKQDNPTPNELSMDSNPNIPTSSLHVRCYCFLRRNVESEQTVKDRISKALGFGDSAELFNKADLPRPYLDSWNLRFVRNVAPNKDMFCAEFELLLPSLPSKASIELDSSPESKRLRLSDP